MRTFVKVAAVSMVALMVACGGAGSGDEAASGPEAPAQANGPAAHGGDVDHSADINKLIAGAGHMNTDKQADADPVQQGAPTTKSFPGANNTELSCTYTDYSLTKVPEKFVALNPNADVLWPGSLVQGKSMGGGILDPIPVKRAPGTITLTLASGGGGPFFKKMEEPSLSAAIQAQNEILASYTGKTPAMFSYKFESIYSSQQLAVAVDANVKGTNWSASGSLNVDKNDTKSRVLIQFTQSYFTMAFDPPQGAAGVFDKSVTADDLAPYAQQGNPPVYVASVTYGRIFYLLFESSESQLELDAAIKGSYEGGAVSADASLKAKWASVVNNSTVNAYGLGGNAQLALSAVAAPSQFDRIEKFLTEGANFDKDNPGVPISYTIRHLTDSSQVRLALTTDYTAKNCIAGDVGCKAGEKKDACGVCGGAGTTCNQACAAKTFPYKQSNGMYVWFNAAAAPSGTTVSFGDGSYEEYHAAACRRVFWGGIRTTCNNGTWSITGGIDYDYDCVPADKNQSWTSGGNSITTGYSP
jgi:hypothetical protein